jgi:arabinan endo-1,5-alpha-L-arabinosidase
LWDDDEANRWERVSDQEAAKAILPYVVHPFQFIDPDFKRDKRRIALNDSFVDLLWRLDHVRASAKAARVEDAHEIIRELGELLDNSGICSRLAPLDRLVLPAFRVMIAWRKMYPLMEFFDQHGFDIRATPADIERLRDGFPDLNWGVLDFYHIISSLPRRRRPDWRISHDRRTRFASAAWYAAQLHRVRDSAEAVLRLGRYPEPSSASPELYHKVAGPHQFSLALERRLDRTLDLTVHSPGLGTQSFRLDPADHQSFQGFFRLLARRFGTRMPKSDRGAMRSVHAWPCKPVLTENASPTIMYGYGDPSVFRTQNADGPAYYLVSTSNDAPNSFPILSSNDLLSWDHVGFVFPESRKPGWALDGPIYSDYWAPEISHIGGKYVACFTARDRDGILSIGLASAPHPQGPYTAHAQAILSSGAIDGHLFSDRGTTYLLWKSDNNDRWPSAMVEFFLQDPSMIASLFSDEGDQKTVCLTIALWPWVESLPAIQRFFALQPLIEAVAANFGDVRDRIRQAPCSNREIRTAADKLHDLMATPVYIQEVDVENNRLLGTPAEIIRNDQPWEGHVVEGIWLEKRKETYFLFYSANDFSTPDYGIGVAVSKDIRGPYVKSTTRLLGSSSAWVGPGHPTVTVDPSGRHVMLVHAYKPERVGYKAFRALLLVPISFRGDTVTIREMPGITDNGG